MYKAIIPLILSLLILLMELIGSYLPERSYIIRAVDSIYIGNILPTEDK